MISSSSAKRKRVIVVGGGFGGLYAAKALSGTPVDVMLIDRKNHHTFQPLLYQVASSVLSPGQIAAPLRHILHRAPNIEVLLGEVTGVDLDAKSVRLKDGTCYSFDYLILAAGARHSYFGHDEWEKDAPGLKTIEDATNVRRHILFAFEQAEREAFTGEKHGPLNFAIIGGGPTGVELAGAIADIAKRVVAKDYKTIDTTKARVLLFEGSPRVLGVYPEELSKKAQKQLEELGVEVHTNSLVTAVERDRIRVGQEWIPVRVALWATGVAASPLGKQLGVETDRAGRVPVSPDLSVSGQPDVFVIGDMATMKDAHGVLVPGLGAAAIQMGRATARNIQRDLRGDSRVAFVYKDKGTMATIGRNRAVALIGKWQLSGFIAWLAWGVVHVLLLIGFRNRLAVMWEWFWAYITSQHSAQLITGADAETDLPVSAPSEALPDRPAPQESTSVKSL